MQGIFLSVKNRKRRNIMTVKKLLPLFLIIASFLLPSCKAADTPESVFDYQNRLSSVCAELSENGEKYTLELDFEKTEGGTVLRTLTYTAPEDLAGITVTDKGDRLEASSGDMIIPLEFAKKEVLMRAAALFSLDEADITDISAEDGKTTVCGKNDDCSWQVETNEDGEPLQISYSSKSLTCTASIAEIQLSQ